MGPGEPHTARSVDTCLHQPGLTVVAPGIGQTPGFFQAHWKTPEITGHHALLTVITEQHIAVEQHTQRALLHLRGTGRSAVYRSRAPPFGLAMKQLAPPPQGIDPRSASASDNRAGSAHVRRLTRRPNISQRALSAKRATQTGSASADTPKAPDRLPTTPQE